MLDADVVADGKGHASSGLPATVQGRPERMVASQGARDELRNARIRIAQSYLQDETNMQVFTLADVARVSGFRDADSLRRAMRHMDDER